MLALILKIKKKTMHMATEMKGLLRGEVSLSKGTRQRSLVKCQIWAWLSTSQEDSYGVGPPGKSTSNFGFIFPWDNIPQNVLHL